MSELEKFLKETEDKNNRMTEYMNNEVEKLLKIVGVMSDALEYFCPDKSSSNIASLALSEADKIASEL